MNAYVSIVKELCCASRFLFQGRRMIDTRKGFVETLHAESCIGLISVISNR